MENEIETVIQIMERTPGHRPPVFGAPTHCPRCGEWGLVDHADHSAWSNHCYLCGAEWTLTRRAVATVAGNVRFIDAERTGTLFGADPVPLRSRLAHPSATAPDETAARRPRLRLAFSDGRRVHPAGA